MWVGGIQDPISRWTDQNPLPSGHPEADDLALGRDEDSVADPGGHSTSFHPKEHPARRRKNDRTALNPGHALLAQPAQVGAQSKEDVAPTPSPQQGAQEMSVAIARALIINSALILADEATGNLDAASSAQVLACLHDLHRQGTSLVLVTHSPEVAAHAGRVLTVRDGRVFEVRGSAGWPMNLGTA
jgi:ABC-type glutathione transport system ATPase component